MRQMFLYRYARVPGWDVKREWRWGFNTYWEPEVGKSARDFGDGFKTKAAARQAAQASLDQCDAEAANALRED